jgi:hypothetical protein
MNDLTDLAEWDENKFVHQIKGCSTTPDKLRLQLAKPAHRPLLQHCY